MAYNNHHHHQCPCQPTPPTTTTCYCTTTHYSSPPPLPPSIDPLFHSLSSHYHRHIPQTHLYAPPQNNHAQLYDYSPPPQIHQKHQLFQKYRQQEDAEEDTLVDPTVSSLIHRIAALESTLRRRKHSPRSSSLRDAAARTIQTHFRSFLVRRSVTLRHLKDLAYIKSALNKLKSSVSDKTHIDSHLLSCESMNLLIKLDAIKGSDPMIRDGKRSISRELIRFMELLDQISTESRVISVKNVRLRKNGEKSVVFQREHKIRASSSRLLGDGENERKQHGNLKAPIRKIQASSVPKVEEAKVESLQFENPRKLGISQIRIGGLTKSQVVVKSQPKAKKNVSFDENGNVYRLIKRNHSPVSTDDSDNSNGDDEEVEEIGVPLKETEVEEDDSSEMSGNEMDPRKNLGARIELSTKKNQPDQEDEEEEDDDEEEEEEDTDSFVFSAPLPAKMEYRTDLNKKQNVKQ